MMFTLRRPYGTVNLKLISGWQGWAVKKCVKIFS